MQNSNGGKVPGPQAAVVADVRSPIPRAEKLRAEFNAAAGAGVGLPARGDSRTER